VLGVFPDRLGLDSLCLTECEFVSAVVREGSQDRFTHRNRRGSSTASSTDGTEAEWAILAPLSPPAPPGGRPRQQDRRAIVHGLLSGLRGGIPWRLRPHDLPKGKTVYDYFWKWRQAGTGEEMNRTVRERAPRPAHRGDSRSPNGEDHTPGGPRGYDSGKKRKGRQRHLLVDTLGLRLKVFVHEADRRDPDAAPGWVAGARQHVPTIHPLWVDRIARGPFLNWVKDTLQGTIEVVKRPSRGRWHPPGGEPVVLARLDRATPPLGGGRDLRRAEPPEQRG
jgi:putative transposase